MFWQSMCSPAARLRLIGWRVGMRAADWQGGVCHWKMFVSPRCKVSLTCVWQDRFKSGLCARLIVSWWMSFGVDYWPNFDPLTHTPMICSGCRHITHIPQLFRPIGCRCAPTERMSELSTSHLYRSDLVAFHFNKTNLYYTWTSHTTELNPLLTSEKNPPQPHDGE